MNRHNCPDPLDQLFLKMRRMSTKEHVAAKLIAIGLATALILAFLATKELLKSLS